MDGLAEKLERCRFTIAVDDAVIEDLRDRLARTRLPVAPRAPAWRYGTDPAWLGAVLDRWRTGYDWRACEARLNGFANYRVLVDDMELHVIVEPGSGSAPLPLVLLNGWPSSVAEFSHVIAPLAHPERFGGDAEDAFTVIVPSYPGYGFSDPPPAPMSARAVARLLLGLLGEQLGLDRFVVHGGDWGAAIGSWMAFDAPEKVAALHLNSAVLRPPLDGLDLDAEERAYLALQAARRADETGYQAIQGTRPQTLAYGLSDSPAGMAAWILEKFKAWVVPGDETPPPFATDILLDNVMIYWINGIAASTWLYCDLVDGKALALPPGGRVSVPTALFMGDRDLSPPPPLQWVRRSYDLVERVEVPGMGHFPSIEAAADTQVRHLRSFFARFRERPSA